ncbi:MAG: 4'-phosphopantetheinyl transferase superfamily protein [Lachnospiraceae bacterium]|nr:4'-phosphopantetheinyl transferase superfamily protein [Lachnospiraceae bacterium]
MEELKDLTIDDTLFSDQRKEKIEKTKQEEDKQLSRAVELLLIYGLKQIDPEIPMPLPIKAEESGNLLLEKAGEPLYFNLSHAKEYAACAISDAPVGIDVECVKTREVAHMDKILHPQEMAILSFVTNPEEKKKFFYECWVTKESYLKNLGIGLGVRPGDFAVNEDKLEINEDKLKANDDPDAAIRKLEKRYVHIYKSAEIENADWKFDASYRMAVCTLKKDPDAKAMILKAEDLKTVL